MTEISPLISFIQQWSADMAALTIGPDRMHHARHVLPRLLERKDLIANFLKGLANGSSHPALTQTNLFENEILLYMDPGRRFSVRLYFHPPRSYTAIHDHSSWGVSGTPAGTLGIIKYRIHTPDADKDIRLSETERRLLPPGETDTTLPLNEGIHCTGSPDDGVNVMISIYGSPVRRLYVNEYDMETGRVIRRYPAKLARKKLARQALESF